MSKDQSNLDIHLSSCKIYKCDPCTFAVPRLPSIAMHIENIHKGKKIKSDHHTDTVAIIYSILYKLVISDYCFIVIKYLIVCIKRFCCDWELLEGRAKSWFWSVSGLVGVKGHFVGGDTTRGLLSQGRLPCPPFFGGGLFSLSISLQH